MGSETYSRCVAPKTVSDPVFETVSDPVFLRVAANLAETDAVRNQTTICGWRSATASEPLLSPPRPRP